jgi:hypothetical protein
MKKILILIITVVILSSCKAKKEYENKNDLCAILGKATANDQKFRGMPEMTDPFFKILDSISQAAGISKEEYNALSTEEQLDWGKKARKIADKIPKNKKSQDSLMQLQTVLDNENTELLIDIVKKRGWVTKDSLGCDEYISGFPYIPTFSREILDEIEY